MLENLSKFINSSVSMASLLVTCWAMAYCYGWGQALYHGYPWWHVDKGTGSIARCLAYIIVASAVFILVYALGYWVLKKVRQSKWFKEVGALRIFILISVLAAPIWVALYGIMGTISAWSLWLYLLVVSVLSWLLHSKGNRLRFSWNFREILQKEQNYFLLMVSVFFYFSLLAFFLGYLRPHFRIEHDYIKLDGKPFYILAMNGDDTFIVAEKSSGNREFIFYNRKTMKYYKIFVTEPYCFNQLFR